MTIDIQELTPGFCSFSPAAPACHLGQNTVRQVLAPLAESAAELLATADFTLVRRCEDENCVLWFYDRTKSHHRRWCSATACGNRNKVAAYRERVRLRQLAKFRKGARLRIERRSRERRLDRDLMLYIPSIRYIEFTYE